MGGAGLSTHCFHLWGGIFEGIGSLSSPPAHFFLKVGRGLLSPMNICAWDEVKRIDMNKDRTGKQPPCGLGHVCGGLNWVADPGRMGDTEGALAVLGSEGVSECPGSFEN